MFEENKKNQTSSDPARAYDYAVYLLGLKLRTEGELREKLRLKKHESRTADEVISQLKENHYIDDRRYAEIYLENLKKYKTFGFFGIKKKLMEKRLPSSIIESVLSEGLDENEETKIAKRLIGKQGTSGPDSRADKSARCGAGKGQEKPRYNSAKSGLYEARRKLARKLKSRGFRGSVIAKLVF